MQALCLPGLALTAIRRPCAVHRSAGLSLLRSPSPLLSAIEKEALVISFQATRYGDRATEGFAFRQQYLSNSDFDRSITQLGFGLGGSLLSGND